MLQINPASTFPICRQIANHTDTGTYYVRGVIKDAINDSVLATVDLDDKGSQYFRYNWKVVYDNVMARGRYITIVTSVYTDSGYTTKSENYGDEINTYLLRKQLVLNCPTFLERRKYLFHLRSFLILLCSHYLCKLMLQ